MVYSKSAARIHLQKRVMLLSSSQIEFYCYRSIRFVYQQRLAVQFGSRPRHFKVSDNLKTINTNMRLYYTQIQRRYRYSATRGSRDFFHSLL